MPDHRPNYCYACGEALDEERIHDVLRLVCPACRTISYMNSKPCVCALILRDTQILLARRGIEPFLDYWDIPGGFLEYGEPPEDGLRRELQEELGLDVDIGLIFDIIMDAYGADGVSTLNIIYFCTALHEPTRCADDVVEYRWFPINSLPENIAFESTNKALRALAEDVQLQMNTDEHG